MDYFLKNGKASIQGIFDEPSDITYQGREFVVSGQLRHFTREQAWEKIKVRGGIIKKAPTLNTAYVIVGATASDGWAFENYGTKIARALELREEGFGLLILSEVFWMASLKPKPEAKE